MRASTFERILMIVGALLIAGYLASMYVEGMSAYSESIRLIAILGIVAFGAYNFWVQRQDQKEIYAGEQTIAELQGKLKDSQRKVNQLMADIQKMNEQLRDKSRQIDALQEALDKANAALEAKSQRDE